MGKGVANRDLKGMQFSLKLLWVVANRGTLTGVAEALGVSHQMVSMVYWRRRRSARIEEALIAVGAPVFIEQKDGRTIAYQAKAEI